MKMLRLVLCALLALSSIQAEANVFKIKFRGGRVGGAIIAPVVTALPVITGIDREDETGTCSTGTWSNNPTSYSYARYRNGSTLIAGATSAAYTYVLADVGNTVECEVTATNAAGSVTARSLPTEIIAAASEVLAATQDINFGRKTLTGFGGHDLDYAGVGYLNVTSGTEGCATYFDINASNKLAPIASLTPASNCAVTITEYSDAGLTAATGVTGTVNITLVDNAYHIAPTVSDTATSHQLQTTLAQGSAIKFGDTIYMRDGSYGPGDGTNANSTVTKVSQFTQRVGGPAAPVAYATLSGQQYYGACSGCNGEGFVVVRPDTDYGATTKGFNLSNTSSNWYLRFTRITFQRPSKSPSAFGGSEATSLIAQGSGATKFIQFDNNIFQGETYASAAQDTRNGTSGIYLKTTATNLYVYDNTFDYFYNTFRINTMVDGDFIGNTITRQSNDITGNYSNIRIWWNKMLNRAHAATYPGDQDVHADYFQNVGTATAKAGNSFIGNIMTSGVAAGGQGMYFDDASAALGPGEAKWNIYLDKYQNAFRCETCNLTTIKYNTMLIQRGFQNNDTPPLISSPSATNMTYGNNISAGTAISDGSSVGGIDEIAEMETYYDGPFTSTPLTTVSAVLSALNPKAPASGLGATGTGADFTAQTITDPDGGTYLRPREAP
jgi:hypothetical protein